jgi:hypothetical protein
VAVEMSYARVVLIDWRRLETPIRQLMRRHEAQR